jgi:hypothetical protein
MTFGAGYASTHKLAIRKAIARAEPPMIQTRPVFEGVDRCRKL